MKAATTATTTAKRNGGNEHRVWEARGTMRTHPPMNARESTLQPGEHHALCRKHIPKIVLQSVFRARLLWQRVSTSHITSRPRTVALSRARAAARLKQTKDCRFVPHCAPFATVVLQLCPLVCTRMHHLFQHLTASSVRLEECGALLIVRRWGNKILTSVSDGAKRNHRAIQSSHIDCTPRTATTLAARVYVKKKVKTTDRMPLMKHHSLVSWKLPAICTLHFVFVYVTVDSGDHFG